jgi:hypothetical protein
MFNDPQTKALKVLYQRRNPSEFSMRDFESSMLVTDNSLFGC